MLARNGVARDKEAIGGQKGAHAAFLLGLILLPSLVFFLYVGAYYRPLDNMQNTPVLVVNMDGRAESLQVEDAIMASGVYEFRRANYEYALQAVGDGSEWAAIIIPEDFSDRLENGQDAQLVLLADDSRSYVVTRVLSPTISVLSDRISASMKSGASERVGEGLSAASLQEKLTSSQLSAAGAASGRIGGGQQELSVYTSTASDYAGEMGQSGVKIASSLKTAAFSADALHSGLVALQDGGSSLQSGLSALKNGTSQLRAAHASLDSALGMSISAANSLDNSSAKSQLLYILASAKNGSAQEYAGIGLIDDSAGALYSGSSALSSGISSAAAGSAQLENGMFQLQDSQARLASSTNDAALSLAQISGSQLAASDGQGALSAGLGQLSSKQSKIAGALSDASSVSYSPPSISISLREANKTDYGTFFATAFVVLGLFFGAASAYVFFRLSGGSRALASSAIICLAQSLALLAVYLSMGFPARLGAESLLIVFMLTSATFLLLARAIVSLLGRTFSASNLQVLSPVLSLLAVFMISSGGAIWPQHTLNYPFSLFAPFIPFFHSTAAVRSSALAGIWPANGILAMLAFCAVFIGVAYAASRWHAAK